VNYLFRRLLDWAASLRYQTDGAAAIEFAIIGPMLIAIMVPLIDLGLGFYQKMQVEDAAQAGAQYAMAHGWNSAAIQNAVSVATALSTITASPAPAQSCGCPSGSSVTTVDCGAKCDSGRLAGTYVTVSAQAVYTTLIPYPGIGNSVTLAAQSTARIR
jgi:Flp pilus assembly protein TadG